MIKIWDMGVFDFGINILVWVFNVAVEQRKCKIFHNEPI